MLLLSKRGLFSPVTGPDPSGEMRRRAISIRCGSCEAPTGRPAFVYPPASLTVFADCNLQRSSRSRIESVQQSLNRDRAFRPSSSLFLKHEFRTGPYNIRISTSSTCSVPSQ